MKFNKSMIIKLTILLVSLFGLISISAAMSDQEICAQEAEASGITDPREIQEYIEQCLGEFDQNFEEDWGDQDADSNDETDWIESEN